MDTQHIRSHFEENGFVAQFSFISGTELEELYTNLDQFIAERVPELPPEHVFYDDKANPDTLKQIQKMHTYDPYFESLMTGSRFEELARCLLQDDVVAKNMQYFNKAPGVGLPTPPHQDGFYFKLDPCEAVTIWLALDDVDEENGCVHYAKRSHELGLLPHGRTDILGFSQGLNDCSVCEDPDTDVARIAQPGDLLAHHALTVHWAGANRSTARSRRALGFIYYGASAKEDTDSHETYQAKLVDEMNSAGKI